MSRFLEENFLKFFPKYSNDDLIRDIENYKNGKGRLTLLTSHFFMEEVYKCRGLKGKRSPYDILNSDSDIEEIREHMSLHPKIYYRPDEVGNIKTYFKFGSKARKVSVFEPKNARILYNNIYVSLNNINVLDPSCGFGGRMLAALLGGQLLWHRAKCIAL